MMALLFEQAGLGSMEREQFTHSVHALRRQGKSIRAIAADLGVNRGRVDRALRAARHRPHPGVGPFVGRGPEMGALTATLDEAFAGRGRLAMLVGQPGIGKTRIAAELGVVAQARGGWVAWGVCHEGGGAPPYWPWTQVIRSLVAEPGGAILAALGARAAVIAEIVPEIRDLLPELEPAPDVDPAEARFRLFDSVTAFLVEAATRRPLVVVLDDLQWADRSSLGLMEFVAREFDAMPVLIVGTYRDTELSRRHPLSETLATLARIREFQRIPLRGLASPEVGRLVEAVGDVAPPSELITEIYDRTGGNPLFVTEVSRDLARESKQGGGDSASVGSIRIPDGVREAIGIRLNRLSEECNQVLRNAAVVGRQFDLELVKRLIPASSEELLLGAVDEALSAGFIEEIPCSARRYQFTHGLMQETLSQEFSAARRARLHGDIGEALEKLYADGVEAHADELAYHFALAEPAIGGPKLVRYSLVAGERALATYAWEEALGHFQRGLAAKTGQDMDADKAALMFGLGRSLSTTLERYQLHEVASTVGPAFDYYVATGDVPRALAIAEYPFFSEIGIETNHIFAEALALVPPDLPSGRAPPGALRDQPELGLCEL